MQLLDVVAVGENYSHRWGDGSHELYPHWIEYRAIAADGEHRVRIAFGKRSTYGRDRRRVVVLIDGYPQVEFLGADDFDQSGDVLAEIKVPGTTGERICRYREEAIPERYSGLPVAGLVTRVTGSGVHNA